jgi:hypothetical protein
MPQSCRSDTPVAFPGAVPCQRPCAFRRQVRVTKRHRDVPMPEELADRVEIDARHDELAGERAQVVRYGSRVSISKGLRRVRTFERLAPFRASNNAVAFAPSAMVIGRRMAGSSSTSKIVSPPTDPAPSPRIRLPPHQSTRLRISGRVQPSAGDQLHASNQLLEAIVGLRCPASRTVTAPELSICDAQPRW